MATISDKPWGQFSEADYTPEQWRRACLVHMTAASGQDPMSKGLHKLPVKEPDGTLNRNAVHAAAGAHGIAAVQGITAMQRKMAAQQLVNLYENDLKEEPPASLEQLAGVNEAEDQREDAMEGMTGRSRAWYDRSFPLEGIEILSRAKGGDGRTVEAYAAVFDQPTEIYDQHGHYMETIHRSAFNRTLQNNATKSTLVLYNHGRSVIDPSKPDSLAQVPLGSPVEIRADGRGLLTVSRYNKSALADAVLEAIRNDDIRAQSFRGPIYRSDPMRVPKTRGDQPLPMVTRTELGLRDYGPTPSAAYDGASILAVRSSLRIIEDISALDEAERAELIRLLSTTPTWASEAATATPHRGLGTEDPRVAHSGRSKDLARQRQLAAWAELAEMEMAVQWRGAKAS